MNPMPRRKRRPAAVTAVMFAVVIAAASSCAGASAGSSPPSAAPSTSVNSHRAIGLTDAEVPNALLTIKELPTGWTDSRRGQTMARSLSKVCTTPISPDLFAPVAAGFQSGSGHELVGERLRNNHDTGLSQQFMEYIQVSTTDCGSFRHDGRTVTVTRKPLLALGDFSTVFTLASGGIVTDTVVAALGTTDLQVSLSGKHPSAHLLLVIAARAARRIRSVARAGSNQV
jgi:hypothetical protein